jgi:hypothetical protein
MSLIRLAVPLIQLAAGDDGYAQDLRDAVAADEAAFAGLVHAEVEAEDLGWLNITQWQWFARWRQALGGSLDGLLVSHLAAAARTRFAQFEVRALVLGDPDTNQLASETTNIDFGTHALGLRWLAAEAQRATIPIDLMVDALQCATESSWYLLRVLTSLDDERGAFVDAQLREYAAQRELSAEVTQRWRVPR